MSDQTAWEAMRRHADQTGFAEIFSRHATTVYNFCFRRLADWSAAEEATQATFVAIWQRTIDRRSIRSRQTRPSACCCGRPMVLTDRQRGRSRHLRLVHAVGTASRDKTHDPIGAWVEAEHTQARIQAAIADLSAEQREIIELVFWAELPQAEAAATPSVAPSVTSPNPSAPATTPPETKAPQTTTPETKPPVTKPLIAKTVSVTPGGGLTIDGVEFWGRTNSTPGDDAAELVRVLGPADQTINSATCGSSKVKNTVLRWGDLTVTVLREQLSGDFGFAFPANRVAGIKVGPASVGKSAFTTPVTMVEGIKLGSTIKELQAAYPSSAWTESQLSADRSTYRIAAGDITDATFTLDGAGRVTSITTGYTCPR